MKTTKRGSAATVVDNPLYTEGSEFFPTETLVSHNDLVLVPIKGKETKDIKFVTGKEAVASAVESVIMTARGELQFKKSRGIPYFESVFGAKSKSALATWVAVMQESIRNTNGVKSLKSFSYDIINEGRKRVLAYSATILTVDGEVSVITNRKEID